MSGGHTPGQWSVFENYASPSVIRYDVVSSVTEDEVAKEIASEADARLIAAAPEMLAQLQWAESVLKCFIEGAAQLASLRAVIAKATGAAS